MFMHVWSTRLQAVAVANLKGLKGYPQIWVFRWISQVNFESSVEPVAGRFWSRTEDRPCVGYGPCALLFLTMWP